MVREGFLKEVLFYPTVKDCIEIRQLKNDRAGVLDRGTAQTNSVRYSRIFRELQVIWRVWGTCYIPECWKTRLETSSRPRARAKETLQVLLKGF